MAKAHIYKIQNNVSGKIYIGSSKNVKHRFSQHKTHLNSNIHANTKLQHSWNKYGKSNFAFEILEECEIQEQYTREQYYMDLYNVCEDGYNIVKNALWGHTRDYVATSGEKHSLSILTDEQAYVVKSMFLEGCSISEISNKTNIKTRTIDNIIMLKVWVNVGSELNSKIYEITENKKSYKENLKGAVYEYICLKTLDAKINNIITDLIMSKYNISKKSRFRYAVSKYGAELNSQHSGRLICCLKCNTNIIAKNKSNSQKYCKNCASNKIKESVNGT